MTSSRLGRLQLLATTAAALAAALALCVNPAASSAETQVSVYGGANTNFNSPGTLVSGATVDHRNFDWEGKPFQMPPYWGAQITHWRNRGASWGLALDYTHTKAYADRRTSG
jgi:lipid A oxidase